MSHVGADGDIPARLERVGVGPGAEDFAVAGDLDGAGGGVVDGAEVDPLAARGRDIELFHVLGFVVGHAVDDELAVGLVIVPVHEQGAMLPTAVPDSTVSRPGLLPKS